MMAPNSSILFWCTIAVFLIPISGYKILVYCPFPANSHYNLCRGIVDTLVDRGHDITFISPYVTKNAVFRDLNLPEILAAKESQNMTPSFDMNKMSVISSFTLLTSMQATVAEQVFANDRMQKLMSDKKEKFDAVIFEYFFNDMAIGFGVKYDCPVITLSPFSPIVWLSSQTGNPTPVATVPNVMTIYTSRMTLWERIVNFLMTGFLDVIARFYLRPAQLSLYEKHFPEESKKVPFDVLITQISGVLSNSHPSIGIARPFLQNTVEIGGYHIKDPEPVPEDLKKVIDEAKDGVIYFSMGSNLKSSAMSDELKSLLLKVFSGLKETVLWKYEKDLPEKPKNVIIRKWMPQTGILAHPNVKLFISHGGLLSCTEAAHFGVPLLAIPIFGDQPHNANLLEERGNGLMLSFTNISESSFGWALKEALENPKYTKIAKEVHRLYHDRPISPRDLLNYHVEHIIRSKGAKHLTPVSLSRCAQLSLDVIGIILAALFTVVALFSYIVKRCCCSRKKQVTKNDKKQKKH